MLPQTGDLNSINTAVKTAQVLTQRRKRQRRLLAGQRTGVNTTSPGSNWLGTVRAVAGKTALNQQRNTTPVKTNQPKPQPRQNQPVRQPVPTPVNQNRPRVSPPVPNAQKGTGGLPKKAAKKVPANPYGKVPLKGPLSQQLQRIGNQEYGGFQRTRLQELLHRYRTGKITKDQALSMMKNGFAAGPLMKQAHTTITNKVQPQIQEYKGEAGDIRRNYGSLNRYLQHNLNHLKASDSSTLEQIANDFANASSSSKTEFDTARQAALDEMTRLGIQNTPNATAGINRDQSYISGLLGAMGASNTATSRGQFQANETFAKMNQEASKAQGMAQRQELRNAARQLGASKPGLISEALTQLRLNAQQTKLQRQQQAFENTLAGRKLGIEASRTQAQNAADAARAQHYQAQTGQTKAEILHQKLQDLLDVKNFNLAKWKAQHPNFGKGGSNTSTLGNSLNYISSQKLTPYQQRVFAESVQDSFSSSIQQRADPSKPTTYSDAVAWMIRVKLPELKITRDSPAGRILMNALAKAWGQF